MKRFTAVEISMYVGIYGEEGREREEGRKGYIERETEGKREREGNNYCPPCEYRRSGNDTC